MMIQYFNEFTISNEENIVGGRRKRRGGKRRRNSFTSTNTGSNGCTAVEVEEPIEEIVTPVIEEVAVEVGTLTSIPELIYISEPIKLDTV